MKKYYHEYVQDVPLYRGKFIIIFSNDNDKVKNLIEDFPDDEIYAHTYLANYNNFQGYYIILNFSNDSRKIYNGIVTHEAIHCAHFLLSYRNFEPDADSNEPLCYLAEWMADEVYKFAKKCKLDIAT